MSKENPFGLHTITLYLIVEDVVFLHDVIAGKLRGELQYRADGSVQHGEMKIGDSVIMMGSPMDSISPMPATLYIYVHDCDQTYNKTLSKGASSVIAPANYPHGDRYGGIKDLNGNIYWVVTHQGNNQWAT